MNLPAPEIKVFCQQCGAELDPETTALPPGCGHEARTVKLVLSDQLGVIDQIRGTLREHGIKHWSKKFKSGEYWRADKTRQRSA